MAAGSAPVCSLKPMCEAQLNAGVIAMPDSLEAIEVD
jgi:hypothetical protein